MMRLVLTGSAVAALLFSGVVHGLWTDRWAPAEDLEAELARLRAVPLAVGAWQGQDLKEQKKPDGEGVVSLSRRYVHRGTGQAVTVLLACGRPGPVSIHTPDVCYAASGYEVEPPQRYAAPGGSAEFFASRLSKKKAAEQTWLRILWSWNAGGAWQVADNPRLAFAKGGRLYKLYLIREMARPSEALDSDPCVTFLPALLPALQKELIDRP
jgi:hypothetical protein